MEFPYFGYEYWHIGGLPMMQKSRLSGALDPRFQFCQSPLSDHGLECNHSFAGFNQRFYAALDRGDGYGFGFGELISPDSHQPRYGSR
jgi:hypothetical protein